MALRHVLGHKWYTLFFGLVTATLLSSCITTNCANCDKGDCGDGTAPVNAQGHWLCPKDIKPCGFKCKVMFEGRAGCENKPNSKCTTVTDANGNCDCKCLP